MPQRASEDNLGIQFSHHVGPRNKTQLISLGSKHIYPLSHLLKFKYYSGWIDRLPLKISKRRVRQEDRHKFKTDINHTVSFRATMLRLCLTKIKIKNGILWTQKWWWVKSRKRPKNGVELQSERLSWEKLPSTQQTCLSRESTTSLMKRFYFHLLRSNGTYKS